MWAWPMRMTIMTMMSAVVLLFLASGVTALPTHSTNDRPIIGILAQEIDGSLADVLAKIMREEGSLSIFDLNQASSSVVKRDLDATRQDLPGPMEELLDQAEREQQHANETELNRTVGSSRESSALERPVHDGQSLELPENTSSPSVPPTTPPPPPIPKNASYIAASYVKFVEAGGARVVPIFVNRERDYYEHILKSINGVLFPGGAVAIDESSGFGRAGKIIYEIAKGMNDEKDVFPIWGTCLGFELMMGLAADGLEIRAECDAQNTANRLKLDADYANGYLLRHLPKRLIKALTTQLITSNFHQYCLTPKNFSSFGVDKIYRALAYSADRRGVEYIAAAEAWNYPFFAVQFHPEKSPYEWTTKPGHNQIPHSGIAIDTANHFAQVYVNYARRSKHRFTDQKQEESSLIYNYSPVYTGHYSPMEQIYVF